MSGPLLPPPRALRPLLSARRRSRPRSRCSLTANTGRTVWQRALPAHDAGGDGGAWLGRLRHRAGDRRRLCRSSELRHGDHRPAAGGAGLPRRHPVAARLAVGRAVQGAGPAAALLRRDRRQHGFHGEPLHLGPPAAPQRQLHAGRRRREAAGPLPSRLCAALPRGLQGRADRAGRHRGLAAPHRALRLLVGQGAPLDPARRQGRPAALRQRRARRGRGGPSLRARRHAGLDGRHPRPGAHEERRAGRLRSSSTPATSRAPTRAPSRRRARSSSACRPASR